MKKTELSLQLGDEKINNLFYAAQNLYGFGVALTILLEADIKLPHEFWKQVEFFHYQELFAAAPKGSKAKKIAWGNIERIIGADYRERGKIFEDLNDFGKEASNYEERIEQLEKRLKSRKKDE